MEAKVSHLLFKVSTGLVYCIHHADNRNCTFLQLFIWCLEIPDRTPRNSHVRKIDMLINYRPQGNVMFSDASVIMFTGGIMSLKGG